MYLGMKLLLALSLSLTGCNMLVTAQHITDAERMCERQKGIKEIDRTPKWLTVTCNNGMVLAQKLHENGRSENDSI